MPLAMQAKILRVLQERQFERVGARARSGPTCASSPPPTRTSRRWRRRAGSAPISSTGCRGASRDAAARAHRRSAAPRDASPGAGRTAAVAPARYRVTEGSAPLDLRGRAISASSSTCSRAPWFLSDGVVLPEHLPATVQRGAKAGVPGDTSPAVTGSLDEALEDWERRAILNALQKAHGVQARPSDPQHHRAQPLVPGQKLKIRCASAGKPGPRSSALTVPPRGLACEPSPQGRLPRRGLGTRFLPATKAQPKEMLPLVDKPTIQYVVEEAVASGLHRSSSSRAATSAPSGITSTRPSSSSTT